MIENEPDAEDDLYAWLIGELRKHREQRALTLRDLLAAYSRDHEADAENLYRQIEQLPSRPPAEEDAALDLYQAIKRVEREGLVTVLPKLQSGATELTPLFLVYTPDGRRALADERLSPAHPQFGLRLQTRLTDLGDDAVDRFEDAAACLAVGLMRPCAVMLGVAFEDVTDQLCSELGSKFSPQHQNPEGQKQRLDALKALFELRKEDVDELAHRESMPDTFVVAQRLRLTRNAAAHSGPAEREVPRVRALFENALWALEVWWVFRDVLV